MVFGYHGSLFVPGKIGRIYINYHLFYLNKYLCKSVITWYEHHDGRRKNECQNNSIINY